MSPLKALPVGPAILALGLCLFPVAPSPASAADESAGIGADKNLIRVAQDDRDRDRDSDSDSGYLGVQVQRLSASLRRAKGIPESTDGSLVNNVESGGPADDAGIRRGDVILEVNHEPTANPSDLVQIVRGLEPGKRVSLRIWRDGLTRTIDIKVGSRPEGSDVPAPPRMPGWGGPRGGRGTDDGDQIIIRGNQASLEKQIKELQDQIARLESEVKELRSQVEQGRRGRGSDDRDRNDDNGRDYNDY